MITRAKAFKLREMIEKAAISLSDEDALEAVELFPKWNETAEYTTGDRVRYGELLYKCLLNHQSQTSWTPDISSSLWVRIDDPSIEWPEWVQPLGSEDAYPEGAKVSHNNSHWVSIVSTNVWEPGVYGW